MALPYTDAVRFDPIQPVSLVSHFKYFLIQWHRYIWVCNAPMSHDFEQILHSLSSHYFYIYFLCQLGLSTG